MLFLLTITNPSLFTSNTSNTSNTYNTSSNNSLLVRSGVDFPVEWKLHRFIMDDTTKKLQALDIQFLLFESHVLVWVCVWGRDAASDWCAIKLQGSMYCLQLTSFPEHFVLFYSLYYAKYFILKEKWKMLQGLNGTFTPIKCT